MNIIFLYLTHEKKPCMINAINIKDILPKKKGRGSVIVYDGEDEFREVDETIDEIAGAMSDLGLLRRPANLPMT